MNLVSLAPPAPSNTDTPFVLPFSQIQATALPHVGGKGANLGEMAQAGFPIPPGFCVTTAAFRAFIASYPAMEALYDELERLPHNNVEAVRQLGAKETRFMRFLRLSVGRVPHRGKV